MFGKSRQTSLENSFVLHMEKEEKSFNHLISTLESIKDEIHKTNTSMLEYNASHDLKLMESKNELLNKVFDRTVEVHVYEQHVKEVKDSLRDLTEKKVDKTQVKMVWYVITAGIVSFVWVANMVMRIKGIG